MTGDDASSVEADRPRGRWPRLWRWWALLVGVSFFAIEMPALLNDTGGDTLTEQIQYVGGTGGPWLLVAAFGLLFGWLAKHFLWRDSRIWKWAALRRQQRGGPTE